MSREWQHTPIAHQVKAPPAAGDPGCFAWERDKTQHVVYRGTDNQIHELWLRQGHGWEYGGAISSKTGGPLSAGNAFGYAWEIDSTQHIVYRGTDNQIHELWQREGRGWQHGGALNSRVGAEPASGDPGGYAWEGDNTQHVIYRGIDNNIHELWQRRGQDWKHGGAISSLVRAPLAAGDPAGFVWEDDRTQHILYRGVDNQIHELWQRQGSGWQYGGALSTRLHGPAAVGDPSGYSWRKDRTQHIPYRGADNQIHEFWFRMGEGWKYGGSLSANAGGPPAAGDPAGFAWEGDDTQHVTYRGQDGQIHELWQRLGGRGRWEYGGSLTAKTGGVAAAGDPSGFAWEEDNTQHIVYRGSDGFIHELWFRK